MEYENQKGITRREAFLEAMESIIPWNEWMALIHPMPQHSCTFVTCSKNPTSPTRYSIM
ncbi:hypothetical protein [Selenomonas massiliensis]|uniref:hypothetical protein n=1 Tax=Selenomonas massiliensis TaxID=2058293 RepID=UPI001F3B0D17|nr:hypothetical protein [Selenomonas massiliensis]